MCLTVGVDETTAAGAGRITTSEETAALSMAPYMFLLSNMQVVKL